MSLPKASTGSSDGTGLLCLRAITTALLALYDIESTSAVLTYIIPHCLVNYDLAGEVIQANGSFLACVRQYVTAIGAEEQCNTLRKELHRRVEGEHRNMFSYSTGQFRTQNVQEIEVPIIIGLLIWVLTSPPKRHKCYTQLVL